MDSDRRQRTARAAIGLLVPLVIAAGLVFLAPPGVYLWLKALHVASAVTWVGGMLGLTYLLSWHAGVADAATVKLLSQVERQLLQNIVNPAMVLAWGIGLWLAWDAGWFASGWFHVKLVLVLALSGLHGWIVGTLRAVARGQSGRSATAYRRISLAGGLVALGVIILAVVKPM
ncbi:MAG: CopD family protein [Xanthobacteraceae bacterium]